MRDGNSDRLYPVFITSPFVTGAVIDKFLVESKAEYVPAERHPWCLLRRLSDGPSEWRRIKSIKDPPDNVGIAKPPTSPNEELDFVGYSLDRLATYVIDNFCAYKKNIGKWRRNPLESGPIDDDYFIVLDERTAHDGTVWMVQIPLSSECDQQDFNLHKVTRDWVRRDRYDDSEVWADDQSDHELVTARVTMVDAPVIIIINEASRMSVMEFHYGGTTDQHIVQQADWVPRSWNWRPKRKGPIMDQRY